MVRSSSAERALLAVASAVFVAGVVAALTMVDGPPERPPHAAPTAPAVPGALPTATPVPPATPVVGPVRVASYARGSRQLVVTLTVPTTSSAVLLLGGRSYPLRVVGGQASGTVPVDCARPLPRLLVELTLSDGPRVRRALPPPTAAFATACARPLPAAPAPSSSSRGS